ncbi:MAG: glycosyltransferase family 4 protein [Kiritimatiellae bacterium]|nr:glycosyltransferase family 4 protein [Kiritimatiellia bacterium]
MKVALLSFSVGAMGYYVAEVANALAGTGNDVIVFVDDETPVECFHTGITIYRFKIPQFFKLKELLKLFYLPYVVLKVKKTIKTLHPDAIHFNSSHWYFRFFTSLKNQAPMFVTIHDVYAHPGTSEKLEEIKKRPMIENCNAILVHSELLKEQAVKKWSLPEKQVQVVPFSNNLTHWLKYVKNDLSKNNLNKILFFGRIRKYKGIDILIKSFKIIQQKIPDAEMVIAGQGKCVIPEKSRNITLINEYLSDQKATEIISESTLIVAPYIEVTATTLPTVAAMFKKPIVASNLPGLREFVINNETGILVEPNDHEALADACIHILKNPDLATQMGETSKVIMDERQSSQTIASAHTKIYMLT